MQINLLNEKQVQEKIFEYLNRCGMACESGDWSGTSIRPIKNCKHCYGRGYEGKNAQTGQYILCRCLAKQGGSYA